MPQPLTLPLPPSHPSLPANTLCERALSCNAEWTEKYRSEREEEGAGRPENECKTHIHNPHAHPSPHPKTTLSAPHLLHIFPSVPPSVPRPPPSPSFGVPVEACRCPRQPASSRAGRVGGGGEEGRGGGKGKGWGKQRSTVAASPGFLGRVEWVQRGWMERVQAEHKGDRGGGLLARLK